MQFERGKPPETPNAPYRVTRIKDERWRSAGPGFEPGRAGPRLSWSAHMPNLVLRRPWGSMPNRTVAMPLQGSRLVEQLDAVFGGKRHLQPMSTISRKKKEEGKRRIVPTAHMVTASAAHGVLLSECRTLLKKSRSIPRRLRP
jgi:hypothetical protein